MAIDTDESKTGIEYKDDTGKTTLMDFGESSDRSKLPEWIPLIDGQLNITLLTSDENGQTGNFRILSESSAEDIRDFYISRLKKQGFDVNYS